MFKLTWKGHFDAAHKLNLPYESKCNKLHGHRWEVIVEIESKELDENGMVIDFQRLKEVIEGFDHSYLNDYFFKPTCETLAKKLYEKILLLFLTDKEGKPKIGMSVPKVKVTIKEGPDSSITYYEET